MTDIVNEYLKDGGKGSSMVSLAEIVQLTDYLSNQQSNPKDFIPNLKIQALGVQKYVNTTEGSSFLKNVHSMTEEKLRVRFIYWLGSKSPFHLFLGLTIFPPQINLYIFLGHARKDRLNQKQEGGTLRHHGEVWGRQGQIG